MKLFVTGSKSRAQKIIYENFNEKAKQIAKYICIVVFVISPISYVVPVVIKSYYEYFMSNTSSDAFLLFYPTTWVEIEHFYFQKKILYLFDWINRFELIFSDYHTIGGHQWDTWQP